ncbi:nuclease-related domain-containing protein [Glaciibacter sp. 2TAF33]|uniref:nuclease-related domain-containing protein n=1 Tax=Glaciibacter sp. 2TAF33 TaxID=3233015 RepID=UPI003F92CEA4
MYIDAPSMRKQLPAQAVIEELLRQHSTTLPRSGFGRFFGYSPLAADSVSWYQGAKGEIVVGEILARLPPEWTAFHALPIGKNGSDIDHLVIGPGGIFTINTKHHAGKSVWVAGRTLMVSGQKQSHIRNADYEAGRVTKLLRQRMPQLPSAQPVLAIVNPKSLKIKARPDQVKVLDATALRRWLVGHRPMLGRAELDELTALIDDPATWPPALFPPTIDARAQFDVLDVEVRAAYIRRTLWKLCASIGAGAAVILAGPPIISAVISAYIAAVVGP